MSEGLLERLDKGPVICAEGYLFELERRGYLQAGAFVPEVVLDHPEVVAQLHRDFVHAGSDVVEAFTYYAHREKMRIVGKEHLLEELNRRALAIAKEVADESGALFAGDICNTNIYADDAESKNAARAMFEEQVGWASEAGVDFIIAETFSHVDEALLALEVIKEAGYPAVVTMISHQADTTRDGLRFGEACKRLEDAGADVVGLNCGRGPGDADAAPPRGSGGGLGPRRGAARAVSDARAPALVPVPPRRQRHGASGWHAVSDGARPVHVQPLRDRGVREGRP